MLMLERDENRGALNQQRSFFDEWTPEACQDVAGNCFGPACSTFWSCLGDIDFHHNIDLSNQPMFCETSGKVHDCGWKHIGIR